MIPIKNFINWLLSWAVAWAIVTLRATVRISYHNDPRPRLRAQGVRYVYAILHAHQIASVMDCEPGTGAMVSRSTDGQFIVPSLKLRGAIPFRGSSRRHGNDKGGKAAIDALVDHVLAGGPACIAVDGPRGPRGKVHKGVAHLARQTGAAVVTVIPKCHPRLLISRAWDRTQVPLPLCRIDAHFGEPLFIDEGEKLEAFCVRIATELTLLEMRLDPAEAGYSQSPASQAEQFKEQLEQPVAAVA